MNDTRLSGGTINEIGRTPPDLPSREENCRMAYGGMDKVRNPNAIAGNGRRYQERRFLSAKIGRIQEKTPNGREGRQHRGTGKGGATTQGDRNTWRNIAKLMTGGRKEREGTKRIEKTQSSLSGGTMNEKEKNKTSKEEERRIQEKTPNER